MSKVPPEGAPRRKLRLSLYNELTEDHLWKIRFSKAGLIVTVISIVVALALLLYALIAYTPVRTLIPGYPDEHSRREAAANATRIDSLEYEIRKWDLYSEDLRRVLAGEETLPIDSLYQIRFDRSVSPVEDIQQAALKKEESLLREDVRRADARDASSESAVLEGLGFFAPVAGGVVTGAFDRNGHPFVDVTVPSGATVYAVLEGTIILTGWDDEYGYSVVIQHEGDLVSVYRQGGSLTRHAGDAVRAGTPIALTGAATDGAASEDHLIVELWHRGAPVDPARYIHF